MNWEIMFSTFDRGTSQPTDLPGPDFMEWLLLVQTPYDDVDRMMIDSETKGG